MDTKNKRLTKYREHLSKLDAISNCVLEGFVVSYTHETTAHC